MAAILIVSLTGLDKHIPKRAEHQFWDVYNRALSIID